MAGVHPPRTPWPAGFPDVVLHAGETAVKKHPAYAAAKSGDADAAIEVTFDLFSRTGVERLETLIGKSRPLLVSAHAIEADGINAIPEAFARVLGVFLKQDVASGVVQINKVGHTGANGFARLARQAAFDGKIQVGRTYVLVDDFVGQGGTLANLKGHVEANGGIVIAATALTGRSDSSLLAPRPEQLATLRAKHGQVLEDWWKSEFGHGFDELTNSEARYLQRSSDADTIRDRIAAAQAD